MHLRGFLVLAMCAALVFVPGAVPAAAQAPQLLGTVGPGFTITLQHPDGRLVTQIDPGTYDVVVRDLDVEHNFHLFGSGVEFFTSVEQTGTVTWSVTFGNARYTLLCDPHSTQMIRTFVSGTPPPPPPKPPPAVVPKKLLATVGPKSTISLRSASGNALKNVKAGTYSVVVRDRSKVHNFHLVGKGVNRKSTLAGVATTTWKLKLSAGVLRFYSDKAPKTVKGSVRVT